MTRWMRRSLLAQMVGVYLAFVLVVLGAGLAVNALVEQQLRAQVEASDQALAQEIALQTGSTLVKADTSLDNLSTIVARLGDNADAIAAAFRDFRAANGDVDRVYWLDSIGTLLLTVPEEATPSPVEFEPPGVVQRVLLGQEPAIEVGLATAQPRQAGVIMADPVRDAHGNLIGMVAMSLSLKGLSDPLVQVVNAQAGRLTISVIDAQGELIATPESSRLLNTVVDELPGADEALRGHPTSRLGPGPNNQDWLYSSVPVKPFGWAVVVQRQASDALAIVAGFRAWLLLAAALFAVGVALLWLVLLRRVIQPLHVLSLVHAGKLRSQSGPLMSADAQALTRRADEVGGLARSLNRLERDVALQLAELQTLLQTSNAVVSSLDPRAVAETIIREAGRLVDVQAATVLVPDEEGVLRVLASDGRSDHYVRTHHVSRDDPHSPAAQALREGRPVHLLATPADEDPTRRTFPPKAYAEGFRAVLAVPIISRHAGGVVLLVHRMQAIPFSEDEVNLLLTFANYATLAWEHAVLYERSDERLREVARENERLYRAAAAEKQTLAAIMGSMSDGLVLTGVDGTILYVNRGAAAIAGRDIAELERRHIGALYGALREAAADPAACEKALGRVVSGTPPELTVEVLRGGHQRAIRLRLFDVRDESGAVIGRGLLLRDVTREREVDEMKTTLLAAVGHELRTPLSVIKGHASTLLADDVVWSPEDQRHSLGVISAETDKLADLVRNLLDLTRVEAGLLPLHLETCGVDELIAGALERLGPAARYRESAVDVEPGLPPVSVDRARIEVVLRNLLANALAYGGERVRVRAGRQGDAVAVEVADDGPGVDPGDLPHLFERFYRGGQGERRAAGTGLGLAISRAFVEAHGGTIRARSDAEGMRIEFTLPLGRAEVPREAGAVTTAG